MKLKFLPLLCFVSIFLSSVFAQGVDGPPKPRISAREEIQAEFDSVPCKNGDRLKAVKALFEKMGAKPEEIAVEKGRGAENVVIRKPAANASPEKIVIGAHYDKTSQGCGAIDNWTGIVALAHIYRTLKDVPLRKNVVFAAFGEEEKGLVGSAGMTDKIKKEQAGEYCAMINIDTLGMSIPQTLDNVSSKTLVDLTSALGRELNIQVAHVRIDNARSDSASFISRKIPAVTIHTLSNDWPKILHTGADQASKINHESVYLGYRLALALLVKVDESDCQAFREVKEKK
ncbi:MAG: M28 family metallopeptidase [Blastocatellales bacterium]